MGALLLQLRDVLAVEVVRSRTARRILAVAAFAVATALSAHVAVPLPGTPVPVTFQTLAVILAGALLGPALGAASQAAYLALGATGLPVFAAGGVGLAHLFGPTGGYLVAFPAAAWLVGRMAGPHRTDRRGTMRLAASLAAGTGLILLGGAAQLVLFTGDPARALAMGVAPFLVGAVLKVLLALLIAGRVRPRTLRML